MSDLVTRLRKIAQEATFAYDDASVDPDDLTSLCDLVGELRSFGGHRESCSTRRIEGHLICDCGWSYWSQLAIREEPASPEVER